MSESPTDLGNLVQQALQAFVSGNREEAEKFGRRVLELQPANAQILNMLGILATQRGDFSTGIEFEQRALTVDPGMLYAWHVLGTALRMANRNEEAANAFGRAIQLRFKFTPTYIGLGFALMAQGKFDEAISGFMHGTKAMPNDPLIWEGLSNALIQTLRYEEAIAAERRAVMLNPTPEAHRGLAVMLLTAGKYIEGWEEFEKRLLPGPHTAARGFSQPQWEGKDLEGKRLFVHAEGGFGDMIHFVRYVYLLRGRGGTIIVECSENLLALFRTLPREIELAVRGKELPSFDLHIPMQSLPRLFKTDLNTIPANVPYLNAPEEYRNRWKGRISGNGKTVGFIWSGETIGKRYANNPSYLATFAPLATAKGVNWFSLQTGPQAQKPPVGMKMADFSNQIHDFADTAAIIEQLDLVVSIDTAGAHLAGALGKPVWLLTTFVADFRWLLDRIDSPWYPTMKIFREKHHGDWAAMIERVARELESTRKF